MYSRITTPLHAPPGWFEDRAAKFETAYPDFYKIPDIVLALEKAQGEGISIDVLKSEIGYDLKDQKRELANSSIKKFPNDITRKEAKKSLKTVESVIEEIAGLRYQFEKSMQRAISALQNFPTDHLNSDEYRGAFSCFLTDLSSDSETPPINGQMMLGAPSIEEATKASLYLLGEIREALIITMEPKEPPMMAILKRDAKKLGEFPEKRRGVKSDHYVQGIILKYAEFFREPPGAHGMT